MKGAFVGHIWYPPLATALAQMTNAGLLLDPVPVLGRNYYFVCIFFMTMASENGSTYVLRPDEGLVTISIHFHTKTCLQATCYHSGSSSQAYFTITLGTSNT